MAAPAPEVTDVRSAREKLLSRVLSEVLPRPLQILSMRLAAGGNSRETWICEVRSGETRRRLVLRCDPDHWIRPKEMAREISGLTAARRAGVPVPAIVVSSREVQADRPFVVTEFVEGTAIARPVLRDERYAEARRRFAAQCGEILARLHGAAELARDWEPYDPIEDLERYAAEAAAPSPVLLGALRWLADRRPPAAAAPSPIHRDFRIGNLMIAESGITAVLDWETCQLGDPDEDLAWLCARSWRYGGSEVVGGVGSRDELLEAYERTSGRRVDPERLHWWSVYAETRWGLASLARRPAGRPGDAMEGAAITRLACRQEHYVLLELQRYVKS